MGLGCRDEVNEASFAREFLEVDFAIGSDFHGFAPGAADDVRVVDEGG